jgi:hypothetical protein
MTRLFANRTACEKLSQLKEVNSTSVERTTLELQLSGAAVYASLAPAQPPPPAGLASGLTCNVRDVNEKNVRATPGSFCCCCFVAKRHEWDNPVFFFEKAQCRFRALRG